MSKKLIVAKYDAVGGPETAFHADDDYTAGPTNSGVYRIHGCGRHSSRAYADWSKIKWGSDIQDSGGSLMVKHKGTFRTLNSLTVVTRQEIKDYHKKLYGTSEVPDKWIFNDFGHVTCYYYKDKNNNGRRDKGERISPEFFHTTPEDEANSTQGLDVSLEESHGCIHVKPLDIDDMRKRKYLKKGNRVIIHRYDVKHIPYGTDPNAKGPFDVHFYPGLKKVVIVGRK